jgi:hypothetical protein
MTGETGGSTNGGVLSGDKGGELSGEELRVCVFCARCWRVQLRVVKAVGNEGWRDSLLLLPSLYAWAKGTPG